VPAAGDHTRLIELVSELCDLPGPTGHEGPVREYLRVAWRDKITQERVDGVGNLVVRVGEGRGRRVAVVAHMDEIGFKVRSITPEGFLLLASAQRGYHDPQERRYMIGQPARVLSRGEVVARGIFAAPSGHILSPKLREEAHLTLADFFVDLGLGSRDDVERLGIHVGAPVVFDVETRTVGSRIVGKAMDDRMLLAEMTLLLEQLDPARLTVDLWLVATVQEEIGLHGARAVAAAERFDEVLNLDVGLTGDIPTLAPGDMVTALGAGPILVHSDEGVHYDAQVTWRLAEAADRAGLPYQHGTFGGYTSDGLAFIDAGMPAALLATPVRYTHTPIEMADVRDIATTVALLEAYVTSP
jgi:endoglucanase